MLGERLRSVRIKRGFSIAQAADGSGLSTGFISLLENGKSDITVGRLSRLVAFYELNFPAIVSGSDSSSEPSTVGYPSYHSVDEGVTYTAVSAGYGIMSTVKVEVEPGGGWKTPSQHPGEEFLHVLAGAITAQVDGNQTILTRGESLHYASGVGHGLHNHSDKLAVVLAVMAHA